jgi:hypothetical protein
VTWLALTPVTRAFSLRLNFLNQLLSFRVAEMLTNSRHNLSNRAGMVQYT